MPYVAVMSFIIIINIVVVVVNDNSFPKLIPDYYF